MALAYTVKSGDCLFRIAKRFGFPDWKVIYNHPSNADFKKKRPNPNLIYPGDVLQIPDMKPKDVHVPTGKSSKFKVKTLRTMIRVALHDEDGEPLAGKKWALTLPGDSYEGTTDGDGVVEQNISANEEEAELTVWEGEEEGPQYTWNLRIGHLDPAEEVEGVQQRLNNLGFFCGEPDGEEDEELAIALRGFQHLNGLEKTGAIDDATRGKLVELHGDV